MINLTDIPVNPGCYIFKDKSGNVIYVGKAKNLRKRVDYYFRKNKLDRKTRAMISHIDSVDFIVTDNEVEALILENNLIKRNNPKYNIDLKDSKRYAYLKLTDEDFPRLVIARSRRGRGRFFGPFVCAASRDHILSVLKKTFQLRTCKRMPKKACLRYHINLCQAPCIGGIGRREYLERIHAVELILKGRTKELIKSLTREMESASADLDYEHALKLRNRIESIRELDVKQKMELSKRFDADVINYVVKNGRVYLLLFNVYKGVLVNKQVFEFEHRKDFFEEFLVQYYSENRIPPELILPEGVSNSLITFLKAKRDGVVKVKVPKRGKAKELLDLVLKNIEAQFFGDIGKLKDLRDKLGLGKTPAVIECFDISHLSGTSTVASMVLFRNGRPDKSCYRRFRIRSVEGGDDCLAISEVVRRRYTRLIREESEFPNLVIVDGGRGQLNTAVSEIRKLGLDLPTISIAKKFEEVYVPGLRSPLKLPKKSRALRLIQEVRDEAHRFALSYNRLLRSKGLMK